MGHIFRGEVKSVSRVKRCHTFGEYCMILVYRLLTCDLKRKIHSEHLLLITNSFYTHILKYTNAILILRNSYLQKRYGTPTSFNNVCKMERTASISCWMKWMVVRLAQRGNKITKTSTMRLHLLMVAISLMALFTS